MYVYIMSNLFILSMTLFITKCCLHGSVLFGLLYSRISLVILESLWTCWYWKCWKAGRLWNVHWTLIWAATKNTCFVFLQCERESTTLSRDALKMIAETSEMEQWVQPVNKSGPLLFHHHNYTHIYADSSQHKRNDPHTVLFLTLSE